MDRSFHLGSVWPRAALTSVTSLHPRTWRREVTGGSPQSHIFAASAVRPANPAPSLCLPSGGKEVWGGVPGRPGQLRLATACRRSKGTPRWLRVRQDPCPAQSGPNPEADLGHSGSADTPGRPEPCGGPLRSGAASACRAVAQGWPALLGPAGGHPQSSALLPLFSGAQGRGILDPWVRPLTPASSLAP